MGSTTCAGPLWSFVVPAGWFTNVQTDRSGRSDSCLLVEPLDSAVAFGKQIVNQGFSLAPGDDEFSGFAIQLLSNPRSSLQNEANSLVNAATARAKITVTSNGVELSGAPAGMTASFLKLANGGNSAVRIRLVATKEGPVPNGKVMHALIVATPDGGNVLVTSGQDSAIPEARVSQALDQIQATFTVK